MFRVLDLKDGVLTSFIMAQKFGGEGWGVKNEKTLSVLRERPSHGGADV